MSGKARSRSFLSILGFAALAALPTLAAGNPPQPAPASGPTPAAPPPPAPSPSLVPSPEERVELKRSEQTIYVPYEDLGKVFGDQRRGVLLPYEDFLKLWGEIPVKPPDEEMEEPPLAAAVSSARYRGQVRGEVAIFDAKLEITGLRKGWSRVPLAFDSVSLTGASAGKGAPILARGNDGIEAILPGKGTYVLDLTFAAAVASEGGEREIRFTIPPIPVSEFVLEIPGAPVEVETGSALATTVEGNLVRVMVGSSNTFHIRWKPRVQEREGVPAVVFAHAGSLVTVGERFVRNRTSIDYSILQSAPSVFEIDIPDDASLLDVEGANVRTWKVRKDGARKRIEVVLFEPAEKSFHLEIETERTAGEQGGALPVPFPRTLGTERERGWIAVRKDPTLKVVPTGLEHLSQIGVREIPERSDIDRASLLAAYRFLNHPFAMALAVSRLEPEVEVNLVTSIRIDEEAAGALYRVGYRIRQAGIFHDRFDLPAGLEILSAGPAGLVEDYRVVDGKEGARSLEVDFARMVADGDTLEIRGQVRRGSLEETVGLPLIGVKAKRETGTVGIGAIDRFKIHTLESAGLHPIPADELHAQGLPGEAKPVLAFRYAQRPVTLAVGVELRKTKVTARVTTRLDVDEDVARVTSRLRYSILYAGITDLRFRVPAAVGEALVVEGKDVKEKSIEGKDDAWATWRVQLQSHTLGDYDLTLKYDLKLDAGAPAEKGKEKAAGARVASLARVEVLDVEREQGFIAVTKGANLEVAADTEGLEPIDPKELPADTQDPAIFLAYKYIQHPYALSVRVTRHEFEEILNTIVNRAALVTVVSDERVATSKLVLEVQNNKRQYLEMKLPAESQVFSLFVDGKPERPSVRKSDGVNLIPLTLAGEKTAPFPVVLAFETRHPHHFWNGVFGRIALDAPEPLGIPLQKFHWKVFVPAGYVYLEPGGDMRSIGAAEAQSGWEAYKSLVNVAPDLGRHPPAAAQIVQDQTDQAIPKPSETAAGGLEVEIVREGIEFDFAKLAGVGRVTLGYIGKKVNAFIDFLFFALAVAAAFVLDRRRILERRLYVYWVGGVTLVLMAFASAFAKGYLDSVFLAVLVVAAIHWYPAIRGRVAGLRHGAGGRSGGEPPGPPPAEPEMRGGGDEPAGGTAPRDPEANP